MSKLTEALDVIENVTSPLAGSKTSPCPLQGFVMKIYTQGIAGDGPCILMDGMPLTPEEIVNSLNNKTHAIEKLMALLEEHAPGIFDDNIESGVLS